MTKKELIERLVQERSVMAESVGNTSTALYTFIGSKVAYLFVDEQGHIGDQEIDVVTLDGFIDILIPPVVKDDSHAE